MSICNYLLCQFFSFHDMLISLILTLFLSDWKTVKIQYSEIVYVVIDYLYSTTLYQATLSFQLNSPAHNDNIANNDILVIEVKMYYAIQKDRYIYLQVIFCNETPPSFPGDKYHNKAYLLNISEMIYDVIYYTIS